MYNRFSGLNKFWFSERITENTVSHLNFNEESDYSEESTCDNEDFSSTIFHHRKKLNISWRFNCHLLHTVLQQEISIGANADIATTKREK